MSDEPILKIPYHWFVRIMREDRDKCRHYADTVRGEVKRRGQRDGVPPTSMAGKHPWWNDYNGKAAEVALCRAFNREPNWQQKPDGGYDVELAWGITADAKFNWSDQWSKHGYWLYMPSNRKKSTATVLVGVTRYDEDTDRSYLLRGWAYREEVEREWMPPDIDRDSKGTREGHLRDMTELLRLVLDARRLKPSAY